MLKRLTVILIITFNTVDVYADEIGLTAGVESFRWEEFDAGSRLLKETGPRFRFGAEWHRPIGMENQLQLEVRGSLYFGSVNYDGQACTISGSCSPFQTDADYNGVTAEAIISRAMGESKIGEFFAGGGFDTWRRDIRGGGTVSGAVEDWTVLYLIAGGGGVWESSAARFRARIGLKYPFFTYEDPYYGVELNPKGRSSFFVRFSTDYLQSGRPVWGFGIYYDTYRFAESERERVGSVSIWQPESQQALLGIYGAIYLR